LNLEIKPNALSLNELQLQYSHKELEQYLKAKTTQLSEKSVLWFNKASTILWDTTQGIISKDTMNAIREYTLSTYKCHDSWGKIFGFVKSFLTHLTRTRMNSNYQNFDVYIEKPRVRKEIKLLTSRILTTDDVKNALTSIESSSLCCEKKQNFKTTLLFLAYTGQRVITVSRLTVKQVKEALAKTPNVLTVEANQDKIRLQHYVPLNPVLIPLLKDLTEGKQDGDLIFCYNEFMRWLFQNPVQLTNIDGNLQLKDLRKFFEQKSDEIGFNDANKNFIMSHGVSSINWTSYKQFLPENVYKTYMKHWGCVEIV
jgi:integrase